MRILLIVLMIFSVQVVRADYAVMLDDDDDEDASFQIMPKKKCSCGM